MIDMPFLVAITVMIMKLLFALLLKKEQTEFVIVLIDRLVFQLNKKLEKCGLALIINKPEPILIIKQEKRYPTSVGNMIRIAVGIWNCSQ